MTANRPADVDQLLESLRRDGDLMAAAAGRSDPGAPVPTCPGWTVRDAVHHTGTVHRWATRIVAEGASAPPDTSDDERFVGGWPDDADLGSWLGSGCGTLADTLERAPAGMACWTFMAAASPRAFWARRQAHETGIHRVDVETATGTVSPVGADVAADGIDEILRGFAPRSKRLRGEPPATLIVESEEPARTWRVRFDADGVTVGDDGGDSVDRSGDEADHDSGDEAEPDRAGGIRCSVRGGAGDLFLWLWNRQDAAVLTVEGDTRVLDRWRQGMQVRWS